MRNVQRLSFHALLLFSQFPFLLLMYALLFLLLLCRIILISLNSLCSRNAGHENQIEMENGLVKIFSDAFRSNLVQALFLALVNDILRDIVNVFVYTDDILISSQDEQPHDQQAHFVC